MPSQLLGFLCFWNGSNSLISGQYPPPMTLVLFVSPMAHIYKYLAIPLVLGCDTFFQPYRVSITQNGKKISPLLCCVDLTETITFPTHGKSVAQYRSQFLLQDTSIFFFFFDSAFLLTWQDTSLLISHSLLPITVPETKISRRLSSEMPPICICSR